MGSSVFELALDIRYFTICAPNYLAYALFLRESLRDSDPDAQLTIVLLTRDIGPWAQFGDLIGLLDLDLPDLDDMAYRYDVLEFATAIKPFCFQHFLRAAPQRPVIYLDPDIFVLTAFAELKAFLAAGAPVVLTPHVRRPPPIDGKTPTITDLAASGRFNLGFAAFQTAVSSTALLDWWAMRCARDCFDDPLRQLFVDQKFLDEAPARAPDLAILDHPGYNVAYWNLHERPLTRAADGQWFADEAPLRFFHFSGVDPSPNGAFSKHQTRVKATDLGAAAALLADYRRGLARLGQDEFAKIPHEFGAFSDGTPIPRAARRLYAKAQYEGRALRPFALDLAALNAPAPHLPKAPFPVTALMAELWRGRPDLRARFDLARATGRALFIGWFVLYGIAEYKLAYIFAAPAENSFVGKLATLARHLRRRKRKP